ncbi:hypothetical protein LCGC14_2033270 [marine sediment metagenome]|uniref:Uncharacterized protein n=1 Tax=marine sediment metagenome TaxID=412755 RepID=A0A0F9ETZ2_9ZZZZ
MHTGTVVISLAIAITISLWLLLVTAGFVVRPTNKSSYLNWHRRERFADALVSTGFGIGIVAILFTFVGGIALITFGVSSYSCRLLAEDLSMEYDHSWARKCRVEVTLEDGREVWIRPSNVRLTEDFRLIVTEPQP